MSSKDPREGFDVFVIDPANRTVEQVELDPTSPAITEIPSRNAASRAKLAKRRRPQKPKGKPRAAKRRRAPKPVKRLAKRIGKEKKPASLTKRVKPKKKRAAQVPVLAATTAASAPNKQRAKTVQPPALALPAVTTLPVTLPAPAPTEPSVAAAMAGQASMAALGGADSMMVLELCPPPRPVPRQGRLEIRLVDVR